MGCLVRGEWLTARSTQADPASPRAGPVKNSSPSRLEIKRAMPPPAVSDGDRRHEAGDQARAHSRLRALVKAADGDGAGWGRGGQEAGGGAERDRNDARCAELGTKCHVPEVGEDGGGCAGRGGSAGATHRHRARLTGEILFWKGEGFGRERTVFSEGNAARKRTLSVQRAECLLRPHCGRVARCSLWGRSKPVLALRQIRSWLPSSITRFVGSLKNSIALSEFFIIHANSFSRQSAMPGISLDGMSF